MEKQIEFKLVEKFERINENKIIRGVNIGRYLFYILCMIVSSALGYMLYENEELIENPHLIWLSAAFIPLAGGIFVLKYAEKKVKQMISRTKEEEKKFDEFKKNLDISDDMKEQASIVDVVHRLSPDAKEIQVTTTVEELVDTQVFLMIEIVVDGMKMLTALVRAELEKKLKYSENLQKEHVLSQSIHTEFLNHLAIKKITKNN